jgi:ketopantoate hydroxymethyltransferase
MFAETFLLTGEACAGGTARRVDAAQSIVAAGIACMGHVGLTPQSVSAIGGFRPQAQQAATALQLVRAAQVRCTQCGTQQGRTSNRNRGTRHA